MWVFLNLWDLSKLASKKGSSGWCKPGSARSNGFGRCSHGISTFAGKSLKGRGRSQEEFLQMEGNKFKHVSSMIMT